MAISQRKQIFEGSVSGRDGVTELGQEVRPKRASRRARQHNE